MYITSIHGMLYSLYRIVSLVKLYCDVIIKSHLQLINTLIDAFFSKLYAFLNGTKKKESQQRINEARWRSGQILRDL